jgi:hypothetical protein
LRATGYRLTPKAQADLDGICAFIAEDSVAPLFAFSMPSSTPSTSLPSRLKPVTRGKTSPRDL